MKEGQKCAEVCVCVCDLNSLHSVGPLQYKQHFALPAPMCRALGLGAFVRVLQRKQTGYRGILPLLKANLASKTASLSLAQQRLVAACRTSDETSWVARAKF